MTLYCPHCGTPNTASALSCMQCGTRLPIVGPPQVAPRPTLPAGYGPASAPAYAASGQPAGFFLRLLAYFVDLLILNIVGCVIGMLIMGPTIFLSAFAAESSGSSQDLADALATGGSIAAQLVTSCIVLFYFAIFESSAMMGTPGKIALGIKVVDLDGNQLSFWRALGRFLGRIVSTLICGIGYLMAGFTENKQALHDMMAGTYVIRK